MAKKDEEQVDDELLDAAVETVNAGAKFLNAFADLLEGFGKMNKALKNKPKK